jgi:hypothetical protein
LGIIRAGISPSLSLKIRKTELTS